MGLVFALAVAPWLEGGRWRCALDFLLSFSQMLASLCSPSPSFPWAPSFQKLLRNSAKRLKLRHHLPPTTCARDWAASAARARERVVCARARAPLDGQGGSRTMKGTGFFSPPPTSRRCASALGQLPWPLREGRAGPKRSKSCTVRLRTGSSAPRRLFHAACGSVFDVKFL